MTKVTPQQMKFCHEYVIDFHGTRAAIAAGYSKKTARSIAHSLLKREHIRQYLRKISKEIEPCIVATGQRVVEELSRLAFHNIATYYKRCEKGKMVLKELDELSPDQTAAIHKYNPKEGTMELYNKDPSLDKLGKHFKLFTELNETLHSFSILPELKIGGKTVVFNVGKPAKKKD